MNRALEMPFIDEMQKDPLKGFLYYGLNYCLEAVEAQSGSIFLLDSNNKEELALGVAKNPYGIDFTGKRIKLGEQIVGKVALERKPLLVSDIDNEPSFQFMPRHKHYRSKSFLSVPLENYEELIGVVNITDKLKGATFDSGDLNIVLNISRHLGTALNMVKSYSEKQKEINERLIAEFQDLKNSIGQSQKFSSLGKVVGGLVHEINSPLDGIIRYVNLAFNCIPEEAIGKIYLREAKNGLGHLAEIARSLLDFSRSLSPGDKEIDVNQEIEESLFMLDYYIELYGIKVKKYFSSSLPPMHDYRLKIAFNNIIKNACDAMEKGGLLGIYTQLCNHAIEIRFVDTGPGIPLEIHKKIFEPFFTTKNRGEGSGLGLAISCEVIQRYNGTISVESKPGQGATVIIRLPIDGKSG